jgi:hypothetical protein
MVDPNEISIVEGNGVSTPDILRVDISNRDVLDDDILGTANNPQTLTLDDTGAALADQGLVGVHSDTKNTSIIIANPGLSHTGLVVIAPRVLVNGELAFGAGTPGGAAGSSGGSFSAAEVEASKSLLAYPVVYLGRCGKVNERLGEDDDTSFTVAEV